MYSAEPSAKPFARLLLAAMAWCAAARALAAIPEPPSPSVSDAPTTPTTEFFIEVEKGTYFIGSPVEIHLEPVDPKFDTARIVAVASKPDPAQWETAIDWRLDYSHPGSKGAARWGALLKPFETGPVTLPDAIVTWRLASGDTITRRVPGPVVGVESKVQNPATAPLTPLREPIRIEADWSWLYETLAALALAAVVALLAYRWWRRRGRPAARPEPALPPGLWALHEIDRRSRLPVCASGPAKPIFTLASEVVRIYIERRYGISAIDMTTKECMIALKQRAPGDDVIRWVQSFLDECDTIKFTRIEPSADRWATIWNDARLLVQMTTPPDELAGDGRPRRAAAPQEAAS